MQKLDELPLALTVDEAAAVLGVSRWSIYNGCASGDIRALRIGRSIRVPRAELARLLGEDATEPDAVGG